MGKYYTNEYKEYVAKMVAEEGRKGTEVAYELEIPYATMMRWVKLYNEKKAAEQSGEHITPSELEKLKKAHDKELKALKEENEILKKSDAHLYAKARVKYEFIEAHTDEHSVVKMCKVLGVSKSGFYKWKGKHLQGETEREKKKAEIKQMICKSYHENYGTYGSPRIHDDLIEWGYHVSQKTVGRYMKEMGLKAIPEEKYVVTTDSDHDMTIYPNLVNRQFNVETPNTVWVADITYIWTIEGWLYLASIMDLFSRKIVGWNLGSTMRKELIMEALKRAMTLRQPGDGLIHHSDRGAQYCSKDYIDELSEANVQISMSKKGDPYDNACIESFHATIKKELIYRSRFKTRDEATKVINHYISNRYNERRKHSKLGYLSPNNFERNYQRSNLDSIS